MDKCLRIKKEGRNKEGRRMCFYRVKERKKGIGLLSDIRIV
jgi:hypothetical protein